MIPYKRVRSKLVARLLVVALTCLPLSASPVIAQPTTTVGEQAAEAATTMVVSCVASAVVAGLFTLFTAGAGAVTWGVVGTACGVGGTMGAAGVVDESLEDGRIYE